MTDVSINRRAFSREAIGIDAYLETREGRQKVRLLDLSSAGAHLVLSQPEVGCEGVLRWLDFDTFGIVSWMEGDELGLQFDCLLPTRMIEETRRRAPSIFQEMAQSWVSGQLSDH